MCCTYVSSTHQYPKGVLEYPWSTTRGTHSGETHGRQRDWRSPQCDSGSAIWSLTPPTRSDLRTSQHRRQRGPQTRIFSPQLILVCRRPRCGKRGKKWQSILTIHHTVATHRADFAVYFTRRDRRAPVMMLVHEECRITCDHRHSLWYQAGSSDFGLSRNAIQQWTCSRLCADGRGTRKRGKRNPERRVPNATFRQLAVIRLNAVRSLHSRSAR